MLRAVVIMFSVFFFCVNELSTRQDDKCPLCKQQRGPMYPILLSGMRELSEKVSVIPGGVSSTDSD